MTAALAEPIESVLKRRMKAEHKERSEKRKETRQRRTAPVRKAAKAPVNAARNAVKKEVAHSQNIRKRSKSAADRELVRIKAANRLIRRPTIRMLGAEYIFAILMAIVAMIYGTDTYGKNLTKFFLQVSGLSAVFVLMSLGSTSRSFARPAIMFGLLVDLVIFLNAISTVGKTVKIKNGKAVTGPVPKASSYADVPVEDLQQGLFTGTASAQSGTYPLNSSGRETPV